MSAALDTIYETARMLPPVDLGALVFRLLDDISSRLPETGDAELDAIADLREAEMDSDPAKVLSHDQMLEFIRSRRA